MFRTATCSVLLFLTFSNADAAERTRQVVVVVDFEPTPPVRLALLKLEESLRQARVRSSRAKSLQDGAQMNLVVGCPHSSTAIRQVLKKHRIELGAVAESLVVRKIRQRSSSNVLIAGRDERGLVYALTDVARAIELADKPFDLLYHIRETEESPHLPTRSITMQLFNASLDGPWYYDEEYWRQYFGMLVRNRFNNFSLTFAHQTNYLNPVYPWLLEVPQYPNVRVEGVSEGDRRRNLHMLKRIAEIATEQGIDFTFGLWTQKPVKHYGPSDVVNFPEGRQASDYCAQALKKVLQECADIRGVQFRMNMESGIPEDEQREYFQGQFDAVKNCGRPVRIDLRYKGLRQQTIDQGVDTGLDVTVSTKYWCEHMGLPFHPTIEDKNYRENRYGYGAMLFRPRNYRVVYRLWSVGSQRILLWGDPEYASRFARSCTLGGGEGFEVFAPLTNKGFGNEPAQWRVLADQSLQHGRWEYERYWFFYLSFGRMGFNPQTDREVWMREFRSRFGPSAAQMETAYRHASQIIPLLTATRLFSASEWWFWPEMQTGKPLDAYAAVQPSDYGQFYAIKPWERIGTWSEAWHSGFRGFVEDAVAGHVEGKWTPIQVSRRLDELAEATADALQVADQTSPLSQSVEYRATGLDLRVLVHLARYHAQKMLAATQVEFFRATGQSARLPVALEQIRGAARQWEQLVELTSGAYHDDLVFGFGPQRARFHPGHVNFHTGHWKDRLEDVWADVQWVEQLVTKHAGGDREYQSLPGETPPGPLPVVQHHRVRAAVAGKDVSIRAKVSSQDTTVPVSGVFLHYRPMDQTRDWETRPMQDLGLDQYVTTIPGGILSGRYDLLYYIEARVPGGGRLWPAWEAEMPYVVVPVKH